MNIKIQKHQGKVLGLLLKNDIVFLISGSQTIDFKRQAKDLDIIVSEEDKDVVTKLIPELLTESCSGNDNSGEYRKFLKTTYIDLLFAEKTRFKELLNRSKKQMVSIGGTAYSFEANVTATVDVVESKLKFIIGDKTKLSSSQQKHYNDILSLFQ